MSKIAILCSGGDVSGMNPAIKHFVEYAKEKSLTPFFIYDGYEGLIDNKIEEATYSDVSGIITRGGTKIGSARSTRFKEIKYRQIAKDNLDAKGIDKLIILGGDGSFTGINKFYQEHDINFCGIPSTIDNDIYGTEYCLGVDTALNIIKTSIDAIRDTASSFSRAFIVETMGRDCGYLALVSALTSGAELCLIPEKKTELKDYEEKFTLQVKNGRRYFLAVVAEGAEQSSQEVAQWFEQKINIESRVTILGYVQRGGNPTIYDRLMAYKFVTQAIDALLEGVEESIVCYDKFGFNLKGIAEVVNTPHKLDKELVKLLK